MGAHRDSRKNVTGHDHRKIRIRMELFFIQIQTKFYQGIKYDQNNKSAGNFREH
jgi:hypothetical protein